MGVSTTVRISVAVSRPRLFDWFIPVDLRRILHAWGPLPAVVATEGQTGGWETVGSSRQVKLGDGTSAREEVTECLTPARFAYRVEGFTNPLIGAMASHAIGEWTFATEGASVTRLEWRYTFFERSILAVPLLTFVVAMLWRNYMKAALSKVKMLSEREA